MPVTVGVSVAPMSLSVAPGNSGQAVVTLRNSGQTVDQFTITVDGLDPQWYSLPVSSVALFPNDEDNLKVILQPPAVASSGSHQFSLKVASQENPAEPVTVNLSLRVEAAATVELQLLQISAGRKPHYHLVAVNPGTGEVALELKATSPDHRLRLSMKPQSLKVPGGGRAEAEIDASFDWTSLFFGKLQAELQASASSEGATEAHTVTAQAGVVRWYRLLPQIRIPWLAKPPQVISLKATTDDRREFRLIWSVKRASEVKLDDEIVQRQGETSVRPSGARSYALSAFNKHGTVTRSVEVQPITVPPARTSDRIKVTLSASQIKAVAGGAPVSINLQVQNTGDTVDKFLVEVEGIDQTWYTRSASSIALMPQAAGQAQVLLQPPKQKPVRQGVYPFAVTVRSQISQSEATTVLGQLEVQPLVEFKASVLPYRVSTRSKGRFRVSLANTGVTEVTLGLEATDLDEGLRFSFSETAPVVLAWGSVEVPMIAKPKRNSIVGEKKQYDITVTARCGDGKVQSATCVMQHQPRMASWRPVIRTVRILVALAIVVVVVVLVLRWGGGWGNLTRSPQSFVDQFVRTVEGWFSR